MSKTTLDRNFLLGGKAEFTFSNPSGTKYRFAVRRGKPNDRFPNPGYFVNMYDPKHPQSRYNHVYIGYMKPNGDKIITSAKSVLGADTTEYKVAAWAISLMLAGKPAPDGYTLSHVGKCGRCGRKLTDAASAARGIGPECIKKITMGAGGPVGTPHKKTVDLDAPPPYGEI